MSDELKPNKDVLVPPYVLLTEGADPRPFEEINRKNLAEYNRKLEALSDTEHRIHVIPVGDVQLHSAQAICWCQPLRPVEGNVWIHHAKDCREAHERTTGEKCSAGWVLIAEFKGDCQMELAPE